MKNNREAIISQGFSTTPREGDIVFFQKLLTGLLAGKYIKRNFVMVEKKIRTIHTIGSDGANIGGIHVKVLGSIKILKW